MNIRAQAHVVRQVPAHVVGIVIDDDVIRIPQPVVTVIVVIRRNREKESAKAEAFAIAAADPPNVVRANRPGKMPVLPGMVEMVMSVASSAVMPNPVVVFSMNVRRFGMALDVVEFTVLVLRRRRMCRSPRGCGTARRNMASTYAVLATVARGRPMGGPSALVLSVKRQSEQQSSNCQSCKIFQVILQSQSIISLRGRVTA